MLTSEPVGSASAAAPPIRLGDHLGYLTDQVTTSGHSHVCLAQEPFLLFRSVNGKLTVDVGAIDRSTLNF